jgi:bifunctional enzyme CysN/CysC
VTRPAENLTWHPSALRREERWRLLGTGGATVWFTGLSGAGKSTIAVELERLLVAEGRFAYLLDGDNLRHGLNVGLGFSLADRNENVRRTAEVARLFADAGAVAVVSLISPYRSQRDAARAAHAEVGLAFCEVHVATPLEECERRDPKGLYARARRGEIAGFTGIDDPYEEPVEPEVRLPADGAGPAEQAARVRAWLGAVLPGDR